MQLHGKQVKQPGLGKDSQSCSEGLSIYLRKIISPLMGKIYSINCIQLVLRDAFFNGGKLNFVLLELCPSRGLLTDLLSWRWPPSSLLLTHVSSHSAWTITGPLGMVSLWGLPWSPSLTHRRGSLLWFIFLWGFPDNWETLYQHHFAITWPPRQQARADEISAQAPVDSGQDEADSLCSCRPWRPLAKTGIWLRN